MKGAVIGIIIAIIIIAGGYYFYAKNSAPTADQKTEDSSANTVTTPAAPNDTGSAGSTASTTTAVKEFTVEAKNFSFDPKTITVNKGDTVKITLKNVGGMHDMLIEGYGVGTKRIQENATDSFQFVADKAGSFEYYCSVGSHRAMGMKGTLVVQ